MPTYVGISNYILILISACLCAILCVHRGVTRLAGIKKYKGDTHVYTYRLDRSKFDKMQKLAEIHDQPISYEFDDAIEKHLLSNLITGSE
jgi:hypothetical protein